MERGPRLAGAAVVVVLGAGATAWAWQGRADPVYDDEAELVEYLVAVKEHRTRAGRLPPPAPSAILATAQGLALPTSARADRTERSVAATVLVTKRALAIGGDPLPVAVFPDGLAALAATGLPARYKRSGPSDLYLPDLGNGLSWWSEVAKAGALAAGEEHTNGRVAVLADASTPYRVLLEVIFTAGQSELGRFDLGVRGADGKLGWVTSTAPPIGAVRTRPALDATLDLSASVTPEGVSLRTAGGDVAPGCSGVGRGVTVPKVGGEHDWKSLTACARRLKDANPSFKAEREVVLVAGAATEYQTVIGAIDALGSDGEELFPDVHFAAAAGVPARRDGLLGIADRGPAGAGAASKGKGPVGNASIGGASVSGGNIANAASVVAGMAAGFRRCYKKGLEEDHDMKGSVRITAKIGPSGEVVGVSPAGSGLSGTVVSCVAARVSSAQFAPPEGGGATIVIPVTFGSP